MKRQRLFSITFAVAMIAPAAVAGPHADRLAAFEKFAAAPVSTFRYERLTGFETLADNTIAVWTRVNEVYLIKVRPPCPQFDYAQTIGINGSQANVVSARFDAVQFDGDRCMIESIRPVDYKAMRAAERMPHDSTQSSSGST